LHQYRQRALREPPLLRPRRSRQRPRGWRLPQSDPLIPSNIEQENIKETLPMSGPHPHNAPKLHNAAWPGAAGKGDGSEPPIDLERMRGLTGAGEVDGVKFDGVDLFLFAPHVDIDCSDDDLKKLAEKVATRHLKIGSVVAPVWPPTGGGSAMDEGEGRTK